MPRFIPEGAQRLASKHCDAVVYLYVRADRYLALGYVGKSERTSFHYRFPSAHKRLTYASEWLQRQDQIAAEKAERAAQKREALSKPHGLKVGDVLVSSWGYDQTNIDFYQVVALVGKRSVSLREIGREVLDTELMQGKCVPAVGDFKGDAFTKRIDQFNSVRLSSFQYARPAERIQGPGGVLLGYKPHHWTAYA